LLDLHIDRRAMHGQEMLQNVFTVMGVKNPLHAEVCSALQMKVLHWIYMQCSNTNYKNSVSIKVNKVHILLSCISKHPVMRDCEERHDLIWL
jgi:hypothetical protein